MILLFLLFPLCAPSLFSLIVVASSEKRPTFDAKGTHENERLKTFGSTQTETKRFKRRRRKTE